MTFNNIVDNIDSLPPLSDAANIVQSLYNSGVENIDVKRLIKVIESDAMLSANILKTINAPYFGMRNKITSIVRAIPLIGTRRIQMLVINYAMRENIKADPSVYGFNNLQFNELCQLQSALLFQWYSKVNLEDAQYLSSLALMMESGKLILAKEVIQSAYIGEFRKYFNECGNIQEFEKSLIGITSYTLSALLFKHWNLDEKYIKILKALDSDSEDDLQISYYANIINIIRTSINVKDILSDMAINNAALLVKDMGMDDKLFINIAKNMREKYLEL
jgi:HD-like signal output (HDOD) protein